MRNFSARCAALALAALTACATGTDVEGITGGSGCTSCHGGKDNQSGAPPFDAHGAATTPAVGAHTAHVDAGLQCLSCHIDPRIVTTTATHQNGVADVTFGGIADPLHLATFVKATYTCSNVYCHQPFATAGALPAPLWTAPAGTITGCGACHQTPPASHGAVATNLCATCHATTVDSSGAIVAGGTHLNGATDAYTHDAGWATANASGVTPHGLAAMYRSKAAWPNGFDDCRGCHGANLSTSIAANVTSCDDCHAGGAAWRTDCTFCHGDSGRGDAAPPRDVDGNLASAKVGAHQVHLLGKATNTPVISNGVACRDCHGGPTGTLPTSFTPHANGTVEVTLKQPGQDGAVGAYDASAGTCASTYCHGNLPRNPKPGNTPSWTGTSGQTNCGTCHAANGTYGSADVMSGQHGSPGDLPTPKHRCASCHGNSASAALSIGSGCFACHPGYQRQLGTTTLTPPKVNLSIHVDGLVEVVGTTSGLYQNFSLTLNYTPPSGGNPASCTTNCHDINDHAAAGAPSGVTTVTW